MTISRRQFLGTSAAATAAVWSASWTKSVFAQDTADIRIAVVGFNGQGRGHIEASHRNIVALCDADEAVLARTAKEMADRYNKKVDTYTDFRKLLERKDIDAITTATPNHIHAWVTVLAAQAGKDVYCEKPASHDIWEGRQMVEEYPTPGFRRVPLSHRLHASSMLPLCVVQPNQVSVVRYMSVSATR